MPKTRKINPGSGIKRFLKMYTAPLTALAFLECGGKGIVGPGPNQPSQAQSAKYEDSGNQLTNSNGEATLTFPSGLNQRIKVKNRQGNPVPGINIHAANSLEEMVLIYHDTNKIDPKGVNNPDITYKPGIKILQGRARKPGELQVPNLEEITLDFLSDMPVYGFAFIDFVQNPPRWDKSKITRFPVQYLGNYSFAQIKNLNTILRDTAALITIASAGLSLPATGPIVTVTAKASLVLNFADFILALVKNKYGIDFNRNRAFEIYHIQGTIAYFFIPTDQYYNGYTTDIKDYTSMISSPPARYWYIDQNGKRYLATSNAYREKNVAIKDKALIGRSDGTNSTLLTEGLNAGKLYLYDSQTFTYDPISRKWVLQEKFTYTPPILAGDTQFNTGKIYGTSYTVTATAGPNTGAKQSAIHKFEVLGRETVSVPTGTYTDCWKMKETLITAGRTLTQYHWLVKDIGPIRTLTFEGNDMSMFFALVNEQRYESDIIP